MAIHFKEIVGLGGASIVYTLLEYVLKALWYKPRGDYSRCARYVQIIHPLLTDAHCQTPFNGLVLYP